ncbi:MAG: dephospho-CoA kinase [Elusimicrobia bacterium]|nr:dephospho-CoA kinase [Elusimicrobiota bacterium]
MKRKMVVALTGGIGSGKTTFLDAVKSLGAEGISCDEIVHGELRSPIVRAKLREIFGAGIFDSRGQVDRSALGNIAFGRRRLLRRLENILHKRVVRQAQDRARRARKPLVFVDVPLLFEAGPRLWKADFFEMTVVVWAPRRARIRWIEKRSGLSRSEILKRMNLQMPLEEKVKLADVVVDNSRSVPDLRRRARNLYGNLEQML